MNYRMILNRAFWVVLIVAVVGYAALLGWFAVYGTGLIYPLSKEMKTPGYGVTYKPFIVLTKDGLRITAWAMPDTVGAATKPWVLYLHGNGGNISQNDRFYALLLELGVRIFAVDYRGYGQSEGEPSEAGLYLDADAAYEYLRQNLRVPAKNIVIFGTSLGSCVAINLATSADAAGMIVEGAPTSIADRGKELYPYIPIGLLLKDRFDAIEKIDRVRMPKLFIYATDDKVVPIAHGRKLYEKAIEPKKFVEVRGGHAESYMRDETRYFSAISQFIADVTGASIALPRPGITQTEEPDSK
jgi:fermentation-respiration switch protein FrsA (DUF1100 family)